MNYKFFFTFWGLMCLSFYTFSQNNLEKPNKKSDFEFDTIIETPNGIIKSFSYFFGDSLFNQLDSTNNNDFDIDKMFDLYFNHNPFSNFDNQSDDDFEFPNNSPIIDIFKQFEQFFNGNEFEGLNLEDLLEHLPKEKENDKNKIDNKKPIGEPPLKTIRI